MSEDRKQFRELVSPDKAHEAIASLDLMTETKQVQLDKAAGRVLAERVDAAVDVPGFDRASVDGYAVQAADTFRAEETSPTRLERIGTVHAGSRPDVELAAGQCVQVSTGAVVPPGANAVVMVEQTDRDAEDVLIRTALAPGDNIMFAGADIASGERALGPGTELTAREVGLLSALGVDSVPVRGTPVVGIVSTGDELVRPGEPLRSGKGQIYDVNSYAVAAGVEEAGGEPKLYDHVGDDYDAMESVLRKAATECDLVLSSGSTSASAMDVVYRVIEDSGRLLLHGVAIKPGKPMLVGELENSAYVGLPGYPVSALTIFRTFVAPAIREAAGLPKPRTTTVTGQMAVTERYAEGRTRLMPVGLVEDADGQMLVYPVDKGSGATTSLVEADGIAKVPADRQLLEIDQAVTVELFSSDVQAPRIFGAGEDDPALSRLLDRVKRPRYLTVGSREGLRRLRNGIPDVAVTSAPGTPEFETVELGSWLREWGLIVPSATPHEVTALSDIIDEDLRFANRASGSGLRTTLSTALADLAEERGVDRHNLVEKIDGFDTGFRAHESPARRVQAGEADAGLGLQLTAESLEMAFVPCGTEHIRVLGNPNRTGKPGVQQLADILLNAGDIFDGLSGYQYD